MRKHAPIDFKPGTERAGLTPLFLNLLWIELLKKKNEIE